MCVMCVYFNMFVNVLINVYNDMIDNCNFEFIIYVVLMSLWIIDSIWDDYMDSIVWLNELNWLRCGVFWLWCYLNVNICIL